MQPSVASDAHSADHLGLPSQGIRTAVSFLIFLHLFALGVAMMSGEPSSDLEKQLRTVPGVVPYTQLLMMDLSYRFAMTQGPGFSVRPDGRSIPAAAAENDHWFEADLQTESGTVNVVLPPESGLFPPQRFARYQVLAAYATVLAAGAETDSSSGLLFTEIAKRLLREHKATGGKIRVCWRKPNPEPYQATMERVVAIEYDILAASDGSISLLRAEAAGEAAPTAKQASPPANAKP